MSLAKWVIAIRLRLAEWLDVYPDAGEGWCVGCSLNHGRLRVFPADGVREHVALHRADSSSVRIRTSQNAGAS